eukprot:g508.t1
MPSMFRFGWRKPKEKGKIVVRNLKAELEAGLQGEPDGGGGGDEVRDSRAASWTVERGATVDEQMVEVGTVLAGDDAAQKKSVVRALLQENVLLLLVSNLDVLSPETRHAVVGAFGAILREDASELLDHVERSSLLLDRLVGGFAALRLPDAKLACGQMLLLCVKREDITRVMLGLGAASSAATASAASAAGPGAAAAGAGAYVWPLMELHVHDSDFAVASVAFDVLRGLLTKHDGTPALAFLRANFGMFFRLYHRRLLLSANFATKRRAVELLFHLLQAHKGADVVRRYTAELEHLKAVMELLRDPDKKVGVEAFYIFRLFVWRTGDVPAPVANALARNHEQLLAFFAQSDAMLDVAERDPEAISWAKGKLEALRALSAARKQQQQEQQRSTAAKKDGEEQEPQVPQVAGARQA